MDFAPVDVVQLLTQLSDVLGLDQPDHELDRGLGNHHVL